MYVAGEHVDLGAACLGWYQRQHELGRGLFSRSGTSGQPQLAAALEGGGHLDAHFRAPAADLADRALEPQRLGGRIAFRIESDRADGELALPGDDPGTIRDEPQRGDRPGHERKRAFRGEGRRFLERNGNGGAIDGARLQRPARLVDARCALTRCLDATAGGTHDEPRPVSR